MNIDKSTMMSVLRQWWWLLVVGPLIAGGAAYFVSKSQPPMYRATATLWVQTGTDANGFDPAEIEANTQLAGTLRHFVTVESNLAPVIEDLQLDLSVPDLREQVAVNVEGGTPLIDIAVEDPLPDRAAAIADAVANQFVGAVDQFGLSSAPAQSDGSVPAATAHTVVVPAETPQDPFAPRTSLLAFVGALLGLVIVSGVLLLVALLSRNANAETVVAPPVQASEPLSLRKPLGAAGGQANRPPA